MKVPGDEPSGRGSPTLNVASFVPSADGACLR